MELLKQNHPDVIESHKVVYDCKFTQFLNGKFVPEFDSRFLQSDLSRKQFFDRLIPRNACLPGKKELFQMSWDKKRHGHESFHYWDKNMAYTHALTQFR